MTIETGAVRKFFLGDMQIVQRYWHVGRILLGDLKNDMSFSALGFGYRIFTDQVREFKEAVIARNKLKIDGVVTIETVTEHSALAGAVVVTSTSNSGQDGIFIDASDVRLSVTRKSTFVATPLGIAALEVASDSGLIGFLRVRLLAAPTDDNFHGFILNIFEPNETLSFWTGTEAADGNANVPFPSTGFSIEGYALPGIVKLGSYTTSPGNPNPDGSPGPPGGTFDINAEISAHGMYGNVSALSFVDRLTSDGEIVASQKFKDNIMSVSGAQSTYHSGCLAVVDPGDEIERTGEFHAGPVTSELRPGNYVINVFMISGGGAPPGLTSGGTIEIDCGIPTARYEVPFVCGPTVLEGLFNDGGISDVTVLVDPVRGKIKTIGGGGSDNNHVPTPDMWTETID